MEMVELIVGAAVGAVGGYMAKDKLSGTSSEVSKLQNELNLLSDENEKLRKRSKESERQVEDLLAENRKLRRSVKDQEDNSDDIEDELYTAKAKIKKLLNKTMSCCVSCRNIRNSVPLTKMNLTNKNS